MSALDSVQPRHNYTTSATIEASHFLRLTRRGQNHEKKRGQKSRILRNHVYLTTGLDAFSPILESDVSPLNELLVLNPQQTSVNLWVGSNNVTAPCHYDGYHNFYVQISGTKRFILASPRARSWLRPFPFLHPSHAQCQKRLGTFTLADNDVLSSKDEFYEAVLEPGDILYLPPLWFHEVTSLSRSISVNAWTPPRREIEVVEALFALPVPWEEKGTSQESKPRRLAQIFSRLFGNATICDAEAAFVEDLYAERYAELVKIGELDIGAEVSCVSNSNPGGELERSVASFTKRAKELVQLLPQDTKRTWLFNFAEALVFASVNAQSELVASLIHKLPSCLRELASLEE
jgi:hypothetical protein